MSLKNGTYQLRFVPAGGAPAPGELAATGEAIGRPVRILPNIPPLFEQQHVSIIHDVCVIFPHHFTDQISTTQWKVTNLHDDSYFIEWVASHGPPAFFSLDGPIRPEAPVRLLPDRQEWVISKGEGENVYRWVPLGRLFLIAHTLTKTNGH